MNTCLDMVEQAPGASAEAAAPLPLMSIGSRSPNGADLDLATILRTYNDVTERLKRSHEVLQREVCRLRGEIQEKNKELERSERLAALGQMAAGVAHEIRNPLGGVRLYASLLERDLQDRPAQLGLVRRLESGVRNMENIVGDILAFAGDVEPRRRDVQLSNIVNAVLTQVAPQAEQRGVLIDASAIPDNVSVHCDPCQIERALLNTVLNACEAVDQRGHVVIRTSNECSRNGDARNALCRIYVEDDGPGIATEALNRLFNPFFTTKDSGTGLGLAIVHRIAEANGGHVSAANRPGGGAVFVLSIPMGRGSSAVTNS